MKISDLEDIEKPLLNFDDKKAIKKRQTSFKPKPKPKPVKYVHMYRRRIPIDIRKQIYDLHQEGELIMRQIAERFGLSENSCWSVIRDYPRQAAIGRSPSTNSERIYGLEIRMNRIERELNL